MMHHPNMHHQAMSGPPQHLPGHRAMSHSMPPLHPENRHVTLARVALGPGGGALGALPVHARPHAIRALHPPPAHHHPHAPQQMKPLRRPYMGGGGGGYPAGAPLMHTYTPSPPHHSAHAHHTVSPATGAAEAGASPPASPRGAGEGAGGGDVAPPAPHTASHTTPHPAPHPAPLPVAAADEARAQANSKEKTPMCLVNELARYNKIKHQYRLTSETGPAHKKVFTVTLRLGETEEYTAEGSSIKRAQHAAAAAALTGTRLPAPPPRPAHHHDAPHHTHRHSVMPTVELNALAMKLCQPAVYTAVPPVALGARGARRWAGPRAPAPAPALVYRVRVAVGGRAWLGEGGTPQAARHDAAARALHDLRRSDPPDGEPTPPPDAEENGDPLSSDVKSPVSLVHELALKRNLTVTFTVKSERGPPHMRVFVTACTVGDMETEGEGNGKKVSKRRAAESMLEEMRRRWPPALLRPRAPADKRKHQTTKKKPRNLIKEAVEGGAAAGTAVAAGGDNPISRLAVARHAARARSPQYRVLEERGAARRREFLVQCVAPPHAATGLGPNKKTAKRRAAHNVLLAMELAGGEGAAADSATANADLKPTADGKIKDNEAPSAMSGNEVRQPVPGVLLMDYHQRSGQQHQHNGVGDVSPTGGNSPGAKDQLMYLSQLLGFTVQFSDFPKRNHGEFLSLVSLSTEPPVMCHGGGPSTAHSHDQCARSALRTLALMGLDTMQGTSTKPNAISNGITE